MTPPNTAIREMGTEFVRREVAPHLQEWEDACSIPRELHQTAGKQGLLGVAFPEEVGGGGGTLMDSVELQEAMFAEGASTRFDPQAKGLGEWLRSRVVHVQEDLL